MKIMQRDSPLYSTLYRIPG
jgi:hypothetical protein